jgi:hypothetical protein
MTDWWRDVEQELERRGNDAPDPWGSIGLTPDESELTPEQRAFLAQVTESPIHGIGDDDFGPDDSGPDDSGPDDSGPDDRPS